MWVSTTVLFPALVSPGRALHTHIQAASVRYKEVLPGGANNFTSPSLSGMSPGCSWVYTTKKDQGMRHCKYWAPISVKQSVSLVGKLKFYSLRASRGCLSGLHICWRGVGETQGSWTHVPTRILHYIWTGKSLLWGTIKYDPQYWNSTS